MADADTTLSDFQFCREVTYFWWDKHDPSCFIGWDEERCKKLLPDFHYAWQQMQRYERLACDALRREAENV